MGYIDETFLNISRADAQAVMQPHLDNLAAAIQEGWAVWEQKAEPYFTTRARANIVNDAIWAAVQRRFYGVQGTHLVVKRGLRMLQIEERVVVRFKKLDHELRPKNFLTQQQLAFVRQEPLPGIPAVTRLTAGYVLTALQNDIERIAVTLQRPDSLAWAFEIPLGGKAVTIATIKSVDIETTRERKVRPKKVNDNERTDSGHAGNG
jgi:hypothetical protein